MSKKMMYQAAFILGALAVMCGSSWARTIVFATEATWPPMEFVNSDKEIVGYTVDFINAAGKEAGFVPVFKSTAWDGIFAGLAAGKYDTISSSVSITEERQKKMDFSIPYFTVQQALIVPQDSKATTLAELKGKKVGAQIGTTGYFAIKKVEGVIAKSYDEIGLAMEDLNVGRIEAVVCDDPVAANYALSKYVGILKIASIIKSDKPEYYGFPVIRGNQDILDLLNEGIKAVKAKGIEQELQKKWIGQ